MIPTHTCACGTIGLCACSGRAWASREYFTTEQKEHLAKISTISVRRIAITNKGSVPSDTLTETVRRRLEQAGVPLPPPRPSLMMLFFRVKCEQHKTWEGTTSSGGKPICLMPVANLERAGLPTHLSLGRSQNQMAVGKCRTRFTRCRRCRAGGQRAGPVTMP